MLGLALAVVMSSSTPEVGQVAPDFTVKDIDGHEVKLSKLVEEGPVILAFFPKARTPG
jgi:peroxiredoxin